MSTSLVDRLWYGQGGLLHCSHQWPGYIGRCLSPAPKGLACAKRIAAGPVVVVGNITAGGAGKSPLTASLVQA